MNGIKLRSAVIRLASAKPELREHLLPLLVKTAADPPNWAVAQNKLTPANVLSSLAEDHDVGTRVRVASNPSTPVEVLRKLFTDNDKYVRGSVLQNPATPADMIYDSIRDQDSLIRLRAIQSGKLNGDMVDSLVGDPDEKVRAAVAYNTNSIGVLRKLSNDPVVFVKANVVTNKNADDGIIREAAKSKEHGIRSCAGLNKKCPKDVLVELSNDDVYTVVCSAARNPSTPVEVLDRLSHDKNEPVRNNVAQNPSTPLETIRLLSSDESERVSEAATRRLYKLDPSLKEFKGDQKVHHKPLDNDQATTLVGLHDNLPNKSVFSWKEVQTGLKLPSQPGSVKSAVTALNDNGRVDAAKLKSAITTLVGGEHRYDIQLDAYSGVQTLHPQKKTEVLQLNISSEFESRLKSDPNYEIVKGYVDFLTKDGGHPVELGKTIAWARVTDFPENGTLIIEELQSDICNGKAIKDYCDQRKADPMVLDSFRKMLGEWEYCALRAVKQFAEHKGYKTLYMVPGSVKSRGNYREEGYDSGDDTALKRVYDIIPAKVGFKKVPKSELPDWLQESLENEDSMWVIESKSMKVAKTVGDQELRSATIRLAAVRPELRRYLLPILVQHLIY